MKLIKSIDPTEATSIKLNLAMKWKSQGYEKKGRCFIINQEDIDEELFRDIMYIEGIHYYVQGKEYNDKDIQDNCDKWGEEYQLEHGSYWSYLKTKIFNWLIK